MKSSDAADAQTLLRELGFDGTALEMQDRINRVLADTSHFAVVAEEAGHIVGLVHAFARPALEKPYEVVVQSLVVRENTRHSGIGRSLVRAVEDWASARGLGSVTLLTRNARSFYEKLGYRVIASPSFMRKLLGLPGTGA